MYIYMIYVRIIYVRIIYVRIYVHRLLDWRPDKLPDERFPCEKTVVLKNLFEPEEFDVSYLASVLSPWFSC